VGCHDGSQVGSSMALYKGKRRNATGDRRRWGAGSPADSHGNCDFGSEAGQSADNSQDGILVAEAVEDSSRTALQGAHDWRSYGDALAEVDTARTHLARHVKSLHRLETGALAAPSLRSRIHPQSRKQGCVAGAFCLQADLGPPVCYPE
jgi:hypothetical protein